jgi:cyclopropane fatty-acyl-phospholipid synthase-like methyltransferase
MSEPLSRYTDGGYVEATESWHDEDAKWKAAQILQMMRDWHLNPAAVCDVGCGTGGVLAYLQTHIAATMCGYEVSPDAVRLAVEQHPTVDVRLGRPSEGAGPYDLVLVLDVLEHVEDYIGFLRDLGSLGRDFMFHIPLDMTALMVLRNKPILTARSAVGHLHYFSPDTALATLRDAGYQVYAHRYTQHSFDLPARSFRNRIARMPRKIGFRFWPDATARILGGASLLVLARAHGAPAE